MKITSSREPAPPPPKMPVTFKLELTEGEAVALYSILGKISKSEGDRCILESIRNQVYNDYPFISSTLKKYHNDNPNLDLVLSLYQVLGREFEFYNNES